MELSYEPRAMSFEPPLPDVVISMILQQNQYKLSNGICQSLFAPIR